MATRKTTTHQEKVDAFELKLPEELQIQPKWEIELPGKHIGLIFKATEKQSRRDFDGKHYEEIVPGYRYLVRNSQGGISSSRFAGNWHGTFYANLLILKLAIEADCHALKPKTRTLKEREDYEE